MVTAVLTGNMNCFGTNVIAKNVKTLTETAEIENLNTLIVLVN